MFLFPVNEKTTGLQNRSGVISIFVSWIKLMQYLRMVPVLGVYILVILKVFRTVMKVKMMYGYNNGLSITMAFIFFHISLCSQVILIGLICK